MQLPDNAFAEREHTDDEDHADDDGDPGADTVGQEVLQPDDGESPHHRPGEGALFLTNGRQTGWVPDPDFARVFFGIWLAPTTSEPGLRRQLIGQAP